MTTGKGKPARAPPPMELDIDSLLRSHGGHLSSSDGDDSDSANFNRRTVDEILNDSDSSDSSPPRSPNLSLEQPPAPAPAPQTLEPKPEEETEPSPPHTWRRSRSRDLLPASSSLGFRVAATSSSAARPLPNLFGSVRANPKPGAALAAAAAASRSIRTPHATAIKNRRAGSNGSIQRAESSEDISNASGSPSMSDDAPKDTDISAVISQSSLSSVEKAEVMVVSNAVVGDEISPSCADPCLVKEAQEPGSVEAKDEDLEDNVVELNQVMVTAALPVEDICQVDDALPRQDSVAIPKDAEAIREQVELEVVTPKQEYNSDKKSDDDGELGVGVSEEGDMRDDIDRTVEERLEQLENSKTVEKQSEKKLRASMKPLEWAEELEKRHASYGLHWEEGAAAQPMRLEGIRRGPPAVGYLQMDLDNAVTRTISSQMFNRDFGSPKVMAVHANFIAIGMSKGAVLVFPSKYSPHSVDHMDSKMLIFGSPGTKSQIPVTSMSFNQLGDLLLVGYDDGSVTLWDVQRATTAKVVTGEHTGPVVHTLFLGQFKAITGDSRGILFLHTISVVPLLNRYSIKSQCLLDGQKNGLVFSASPLLIDDSRGISHATTQGNSTTSPGGLGGMVGGVVGGVVGGEAGWKLFNEGSSSSEEGVVIFVTHHNALVLRLTPNVEVYDKITKPDGVREGSLPYTAWRFPRQANDSSLDASERSPWLVIVWDRRVQVAQLVNSKIKIFREWCIESMAIGVAWLDDQILVVLTVKGQFCLFTKDATELYRSSFVSDGSSLDEIISYHIHFTNTFGNPEKAYHNAVAVRGSTIYILGSMHLLISRLLPWKERIQVLQRAGDWMGALDMAMRLYDGHTQGVIDLPRSVDVIRVAIMPFLIELLLSYVDEVFSYISISFCTQISKVGQFEDPKFGDSSVQSEIEEQYARVGGVAVEFCVHIKRTDILFDNIFSKFVSVKHGGTFLEILEPYILKDMLGCLPPGVMQDLVQHYSAKGWLQRVEQCVLHMDISSLDFNQVVKLCREHGLFGALIYLFNRGLDDFKAPLEELLIVMRYSENSDVASIGYRMLVYLKYCFQGLAFPPGHGSLFPSCVPSVRKELVQFLLEDSKPVPCNMSKRYGLLDRNFPNLLYLFLLDTEATINVLRFAFSEEQFKISEVSLGSLSSANLGTDQDKLQNQKIMAQSTVDVLISILDLESDVIRSFAAVDSSEAWPSKNDVGHLFEFITFLVSYNGATIAGRVFKHIIKHLASRSPGEKAGTTMEEQQVVSLLKVVPRTEWDSSYVLHLCTESKFYQACGLVHTVNGQYIDALDSFMHDVNEPIHAFAFINSMLSQLSDVEASSFQSAVVLRIPELVKLSGECTYFLVIDHFGTQSLSILSELQSHPQSLFLFLKSVMDVYLSGSLKFPVPDVAQYLYAPRGNICSIPKELETYLEKLSGFPKLLQHNMIQVTDEIAELYLELLCKYERNSVLKFLETFDNYKLEHCLWLCQEYGVNDAAAYLLERVGDVGSALGLVMTGLHDKIDMLVAAVGNKLSETASGCTTEADQFISILEITEVINVHDVLNASVGLCQRNTQRLNQQESEDLWFHLLDSFSEPLRGFFHDMKSSVDSSSTITDVPNELDFSSGGKVSRNIQSTNILRRVFSMFVGEIIEGMIGYVPLPAIMEKLLSDNGNQEFGVFKLTILKMLGTYGYEKRILDTAKSLIEEDTYYTMGLLKKGATHAFAPQGSVCCICGCSFSKDSAFGIRLFNCGHSTHLHCESEENEQSNSLFGCPICFPKKNSGAKNESARNGAGLVATSASGSQKTGGMSNVQHVHEPELEKPHALLHMPRFEILSNLRKSHKHFEIEALPQLRLSPPAVYHEKVQKGVGLLTGETSNKEVKNEKSNKRWQMRDLKSKGSLNRFPLKSSIFGPEKSRVH